MMQIYVKGIGSGYEPEHTARLFFHSAQLAKRWPPARLYKNAAIAHVTKKHILVGVRQNGKTAFEKTQLTIENLNELDQQALKKAIEYKVCALFYKLLCKQTGTTPPWGMLTGVRPVRLVHDMKKQGKTEAEIKSWFCQKHFVSEQKYNLANKIASVQAPIMENANKIYRPYSLYISIPFCPSRCSYCSFVSRTTGSSRKEIEPYMQKLCCELEDIAATARRNNLTLVSIYIGGGTPTAITESQLQMLMQTVKNCFDISKISEYTVEAGRPDCTNFEKLQIIKEYGATRISINPQTLSDEVLKTIGRNHSAKAIIDCFETARKVGHNNINMDLIAGLPNDTIASFEQSMKGVLSLSPENITVHTLTLKRASNLVIDNTKDVYGDVSAMVEISQNMLNNHPEAYEPYYLYRQKGTLGNLENVGYAKHNFAGLYNVYIMEEVHTILSAGAGGSTKLVDSASGRIERIFNHKYPLEYLQRFDVVQQRKKGVDDFYGKYFDLDT